MEIARHHFVVDSNLRKNWGRCIHLSNKVMGILIEKLVNCWEENQISSEIRWI